MDVHHLTYIITIAECKNMTKAAQKLFVSQSALSQHLTKLEQELQTPLFNRAKGELVLTPAGKLYVKTAREVVEKQKILYREIAALGLKGHISIGATSNFALSMLSDVVPSYKEQFPDVNLEISELSLPAVKSMILSEGLDLAIAASAFPDSIPDQTIVLREEPVYLVLSTESEFYKNKYPKGSKGIQSLSLKELSLVFEKEDFISTKDGASIRMVTSPIFDALHLKPRIICETNHISSTLQMVANKVGAAFIGKSCVEETDSLCYFNVEPGIKRYNVLISRKGWPQTAPEQELVNMIRTYFS